MLVLIAGAFVDGLAGIVSHILATGIKQLKQTNQVADFKTLKELFESTAKNTRDIISSDYGAFYKSTNTDAG